MPSAPISEHVTDDADPAVDPVRPASQVSPPRREAEVRISSRVNKGKTSVFKDYLTGDEMGMIKFSKMNYLNLGWPVEYSLILVCLYYRN